MARVSRVRRYSKTISVMVSDEVYKVILRKAEKENRTFSDVARELIEHAIKSLKLEDLEFSEGVG